MPVTRDQMREILVAKAVLKQKGWTYRLACLHLDYSYTHFAFVMSGRRYTKKFLAEIAALPPRSELTPAAAVEHKEAA